MSSCDICVTGLPSSVDDVELRELFSVFGQLSSARITRQGTQCYGFVSFQLPKSALAATAAMRGFNHKGASIHVRLAGHTDNAEGTGAQNLNDKTPARTPLLSGQRLTGCILTWRGSYGWISADEPISHPSAARHGGSVFVSMTDVTDSRLEMKEGVRVSFTTYVDSEGVGAADIWFSDGERCVDALSGLTGQTTVHVDGWPPTLEDCFKKTFEHFGQVASSKVSRPKQGSRSSGELVFVEAAAARAAISAMNGKLYGGKPLQVWVESSLPDGGYSASPTPCPVPASVPAPRPSGDPDVRTAVGDERMTGRVKSWKGKFGWLTADKVLHDPPGARHKGWVFVSSKDLVGATVLQPGERVSFLVYVDGQGNGASDVQLLPKERPLGRRVSGSAPAPPAPAATPQTVSCWWHQLAGDCCPLSLTPLEELEYEPFGLRGDVSGSPAAELRGLWGAEAQAALPTLQAVHWFDGRFLACSLVAKSQFMDPVSRRPLSHSECDSLDAYLAANGLPALGVADAFVIAGNDATPPALVDAAAALRALDVAPTPVPAPAAKQMPAAADAARKGRRWGRER